MRRNLKRRRPVRLPVALIAFLLGFQMMNVAAVSSAELPEQGRTIENEHFLTFDSRLLGEAIKELSHRSGIQFRLPARLERDKVSGRFSGETWVETAKSLLRGYNYAVIAGENGEWRSVAISGRNGDAKVATGRGGKSGLKSPDYSRQSSSSLPARFRGLNPGSVTPVTLPLATLKKMKKGQTVTLELPTGSYSLVHDNLYSHGDDGSTWSGNLLNEGLGYRGMITMGSEGPMGHLLTPEGNFLFFSEGGQTYVVDIDASGLQPGSYIEDQAFQDNRFSTDSLHTTAPVPVSFGSKAWAEGGKTSSGAQQSSSGSSPLGKNEAATTVIDLMVVYSKNLAQADTRINYLADVTNQAYLDSKVDARIRIVHTLATDYADTNDNSQALTDLSLGNAPFDKIQDLRKKYGADLVALIRPFHASAQKTCGIAWVNGSNGTTLNPNLAFSEVSDGNDADGQAFLCGPQTLAHELGHNLGNVHDRQFSNAPGAFPYSYAWGVEGSFGTIMSYLQPNLYLFASPSIGDVCLGQPCGYPEGDPNASDNARTINETAPVVANFLPNVAPTR